MNGLFLNGTLFKGAVMAQDKRERSHSSSMSCTVMPAQLIFSPNEQ